MNGARPIKVVSQDGKEILFPSRRQTMKHYNIQDIQLDRSLRSGLAVLRGVRKGLTFTYVDQT